MSWSGFVKTMNRAGTSLMQKTGQVEKTVDKEYEEEERRFKRFEANLEKLHTETRGYLESVVALTTSQQRISEVVCQILSDPEQAPNPAAEQYKQVTDQLETDIRAELDNNIRSTVLEPVGRVIAHFPLINETIKRRNNKILDHDAARTKLYKLNQKPPDDNQKLVKAEAAAQEAQEAYETVNSQLITEIPRLIDSRLQLLDPSFEALVKAQLQFATRTSDHFHAIQSHFPVDASADDLDQQVEAIMHKMRDLTICGLV